MFDGITDLVLTVVLTIIVLVVVGSILFFIYDTLVTILKGRA